MSLMRLFFICSFSIVLASCAQTRSVNDSTPQFKLVQNERVISAIQTALDRLDGGFATPLGSLGALQEVEPFEQYTPYETGALWMVKGLVLRELGRHEAAADAYLRAIPLIGYQFPQLCPLLKEAVLINGVNRSLEKCAG